MNEALGVAKSVSSADNPLLYFLIFVFAIIAFAVWRAARTVTSIYLPMWADQSKRRDDAIIDALSKIPEIVNGFGKELLGVEVRIDRKVEITKDEILTKIDVTRTEVLKEVRDDRLKALASELRDSQTNEGRRIREPSSPDLKKGRDSRPG